MAGDAPLSPPLPSDRPRERLLAEGPRALSDADLLALVLGSGTGRLSARAAAPSLAESMPVAELAWAPAEVLSGRPGIGPARAVVSPRDAPRPAVRQGAHGVVFVHNHPSGAMCRPGSCGRRPARTRRRAIRCAIRSHDEVRAEATP